MENTGRESMNVRTRIMTILVVRLESFLPNLVSSADLGSSGGYY
jgi:hypothetical protein